MYFREIFENLLNEKKKDPKIIADTILKQLGGSGKLTAMIGASNFAHDKDGTLSFKIPSSASKKHRYVKISLNEKDLYDIQFLSSSLDVSKEIKDVQVGNLIRVFEETLELDLRL